MQLSEKALQYLQKIETAAGRMQSMIDGVLQYSSVTEKAQQFETIDMNSLVGDIINDLEVVISHKRQKLKQKIFQP